MEKNKVSQKDCHLCLRSTFNINYKYNGIAAVYNNAYPRKHIFINRELRHMQVNSSRFLTLPALTNNYLQYMSRADTSLCLSVSLVNIASKFVSSHVEQRNILVTSGPLDGLWGQMASSQTTGHWASLYTPGWSSPQIVEVNSYNEWLPSVAQCDIEVINLLNKIIKYFLGIYTGLLS